MIPSHPTALDDRTPSALDLCVARLLRGLSAEPTQEREPARWGHYLGRPVEFARDVLGIDLWSAQRRIAEAVIRERSVAVRSAFDIGKSFTAGVLACYWIGVHPIGEAFVVTTAPTHRQVKSILWREIRRLHRRGNLVGYITQTPDWKVGKEIVAYGTKPQDDDESAFQGVHDPYVLVIIDEASGISRTLATAADALITNEDSRLLLIGNPLDPQSAFGDASKPGSGYMTIRVSAFESPNFTGEPVAPIVRQALVSKRWVEEKRRKWAPRWEWTPDGSKVVPGPGASATDCLSDWTAKVLAEFPESTENTLIPRRWIEAAQARELPPTGSTALGVDVGGGGDRTTKAHRRGPVVRVIAQDQNPDTMQTALDIIARAKALAVESVQVDVIGIGRGAVDRVKEEHRADVRAAHEHAAGNNGHRPVAPTHWLAAKVVGVNVSEKASQPERFQNLRAELWWGVRERFETGDIDLDPEDDDTAAELAEMRYYENARGQICIESKDEMKGRIGVSPDRADAVMLACADGPRVRGISITPVVTSLPGVSAFSLGHGETRNPALGNFSD